MSELKKITIEQTGAKTYSLRLGDIDISSYISEVSVIIKGGSLPRVILVLVPHNVELPIDLQAIVRVQEHFANKDSL